jgi:hypothetical protein
MKITKHICFYYIENRIKYLNQIIDETSTYDITTDIYIHTNNLLFSTDVLNNYSNGSIKIVYYDLANNIEFNANPLRFPYYMREFIKSQHNDYDIFIYVEDDILIPKKAIEYWLQYKDIVLKHNYNLEFFRIEVDKNNIEYTIDNGTCLTESIDQHLTKTIYIDNELYILNDQNPYCAFWIYDKNEFNKYINSPYYNTFDKRQETMAFGLHKPDIICYNGTIVPLQNNKLHKDCRVYHIPNKFINSDFGWKIHLFDEVCKI